MIPNDYVNIDTSPKPCRCRVILDRLAELTAAVGFAAFLYCLAVFCFSL